MSQYLSVACSSQSSATSLELSEGCQAIPPSAYHGFPDYTGGILLSEDRLQLCYWEQVQSPAIAVNLSCRLAVDLSCIGSRFFSNDDFPLCRQIGAYCDMPEIETSFAISALRPRGDPRLRLRLHPRSRLKSRPPPVSVHSGDVQHCMTFYPTMNQDENRAAFGSTAGSSIDQDGSPKEHEQSSVPGPIRHNGPGRKPRACPPCKRLKMKCEALPGDASRCTRCARRGLVCQLSSVTFDDKSPQQTDYG